jgi:hypothetical protein
MVHQLIDMKFLFFCRATYVNKQGLSPIVLRITYRGQRADIFTGLNCDPDSWNATSQRVSGYKDYFEIKGRHSLEEMKGVFVRQFNVKEDDIWSKKINLAFRLNRVVGYGTNIYTLIYESGKHISEIGACSYLIIYYHRPYKGLLFHKLQNI